VTAAIGRRVPARDPSSAGRHVRRSTPERLDAARRAAALASLISDGELPDEAEAALPAWDRQAIAPKRARNSGYR